MLLGGSGPLRRSHALNQDSSTKRVFGSRIVLRTQHNCTQHPHTGRMSSTKLTAGSRMKCWIGLLLVLESTVGADAVSVPISEVENTLQELATRLSVKWNMSVALAFYSENPALGFSKVRHIRTLQHV
jgi:hypothetical protein